jgi:Domain of unknown function (DUF3471)
MMVSLFDFKKRHHSITHLARSYTVKRLSSRVQGIGMGGCPMLRHIQKRVLCPSRVLCERAGLLAEIAAVNHQTETYVKQNGSWLLVARQWGNLPVNFHKPVAVDTSVYKDYVGQYQWRPLDDLDTVSVEDGKLWSRFPKDEDEYLPLSSDTFFVKDDIGSVTFVRDAQGHVTGYTYHRDDGQEIHAKKIK